MPTHKAGSLLRWPRATVTALLLALPATAHAQTPGARGGASPDTIRWIGVWEPVNYSGDLQLLDVHFATPDIGWVAGGANVMTGGVILHTVDAGKTWDIQLGDPESADRAYVDLRFVDEKTGFAAQSTPSGDHRLLRTTDGETWTVAGTVPQHRSDYIFVSPTTGFAAFRPGILKTDDAGKTWKPVLQCRASVQVEGLSRQVDCEIDNFAFPTPTTGYAVGFSYGAPGVFVAKTTDGGDTWRVSVALPEESGREAHIRFTDERHGVGCLGAGGKLFGTSDGGETWALIAGPSCDGKPWVKFAGDVGWTLIYDRWDFTTNGGSRWTSRQVAFPTSVNAFDLVRSDRGYAVGDHGMIYRYRVVPDTTKLVPRTLTVPAMPRAGG